MKQLEFEVILEDINGKLDVIIEAQDFMKTKVAKIEVIEQDIAEIKADVSMIKFAVKTHDKDLRNLKAIHPEMRHA